MQCLTKMRQHVTWGKKKAKKEVKTVLSGKPVVARLIVSLQLHNAIYLSKFFFVGLFLFQVEEKEA